MMAEALERIERTATRVQAFARPRGITLQSTDVNQAVEATLEVLGTSHVRQRPHRQGTGRRGRRCKAIPTRCRKCSSISAPTPWRPCPSGGTLTLAHLALGRKDEDQMGSVAIDVSDTGVGIPRVDLEKIFEPFYTTRRPAAARASGWACAAC